MPAQNPPAKPARPMPDHFRVGYKPAPPPPAPPVPLETYAELGDVVFWYPGADPAFTPMVGVVTAIGVQTVDVNTFTSSLHNTVPQEAAMHLTDPRARTEANGGGGWAHRPETLAFRRLLLAAGCLVWNGKDKYEIGNLAGLAQLGELLSPVPKSPPAAEQPKSQ